MSKHAPKKQGEGSFHPEEVPAAEDLKDWTASLGINRRAVPSLPQNFCDGTLHLGLLIVGSTIMYKYYAKRNGGWFAAVS